MTSQQLHLLGVGQGSARSASDGFVGSECVWSTYSTTIGGRYLARILRGAHPAGTPTPEINTLPAARYAPPGLDPTRSCVYLISLTSEQTLWAQYADPSGNPAGVTHEVACDQAQPAASYMASTYFTLPR